MNITEFRKVVCRHGGWIEGGAAMFPTVHASRKAAQAIEARQRQDAKTGLVRKDESAVP